MPCLTLFRICSKTESKDSIGFRSFNLVSAMVHFTNDNLNVCQAIPYRLQDLN